MIDAVTTNAAAIAMRRRRKKMKWMSGTFLASYPPLEGEGRLILSAAKYAAVG
ncbi:hypothetical protein LRP30_43540 [Bradyrhizobium sp. C-145]|uniref:hypothetical protein n=1 Tax=Bradyrhizobium sp. C-145 TaxID=574727 RepID=UPI00201B8A1D|nr:hypothetical protein [Bradyrhizobium sp. C-145]UQR68267.1 hypothetical protein LRP30_43540 [Bradyrhizobium sp. C-145]